MIGPGSNGQASMSSGNIINNNSLSSSAPSTASSPSLPSFARSPAPNLGGFPYPDSSYVPIEIWESIIDLCYDAPMLCMNDTSKSPLRTWSACATTCRSWYYRSRLRIYQNILLASDDQVKRLAACLKLNPRNTAYVVSLYLQSDPHGSHWAHYLAPMFLGSFDFPNLKEVTITKGERNFTGYSPDSLKICLKFGIDTYSVSVPSWPKYSGTIRKLNLYDIEKPPFVYTARLVLAFPAIEELDLGRINAFPRGFSNAGQYSYLPLQTVAHAERKDLRLKALRVGFTRKGLLTCRWLSARGSLDGLEKLKLWRVECWIGEEMDLMHEMLRVARETVVDVSLGLVVYVDEHEVKEGRKNDIISLSLHDLSNLRTLSLLEAPAIYGSSKPTISWLITTLTTISSRLLTSLTFRVYLWDFIVKDWDALDDLLTSKQFASLKYVNIEAFRIFDAGKGINISEAVDSEGRTLKHGVVKEESGSGFTFLLKKLAQKKMVEVILEDYDDNTKV